MKRKSKKKWIQSAVKKMEQKGTVGEFTRKAKRAGFKSAKSYANYVLKNKNRFSTKTIRQAVFAKNAGKSRR